MFCINIWGFHPTATAQSLCKSRYPIDPNHAKGSMGEKYNEIKIDVPLKYN